ncbi:MAG TPA: carboxypeptidase regulatory-like domain-containing protein [Verrucomicrobiae bacterium]|nr:carboxypeptidase regulatory-like domain-containing protein [Verrucomicrobiae bacterium]
MFGRLVWSIVLILGLASGTQAQFTLSGKITDPNGTGIANVDVDLYDINGNPVGILTDKTDALGNYNLNQPFGLPAGTYDVAFTPPAVSNLAPVYNTGYLLSGNQVFNDTVPLGFTLSGFVRDTAGVGQPDIDLNVTDELTGQLVYTPNPTDNTDPFGFYSLVLPANGVYTLTYRPVAAQKLVAAEFKGIIFNSNQTRDVVLQAGFFVSGTVVDNNSQPVRDADMDFDVSATQARIPTPNDNTDNNGFYQVVVGAGTYDITVEPLVDDKLIAGLKFSVPVTKDTSIDFVLQPGLYLSGFVRRASDNAGVANVDIDVHDTLTNTKIPTPFDFTDGTGFYQIVVPAGAYDVTFQPPVVSGLAPVESLHVAVAADRTLNATVLAGFTLSGNVQRAGGGGLSNINIKFVNSATGAKVPLANHFTNALGNYSVVAVPGSYTVEFEPPKSIRRAAKDFPNFALNSNMTLNVTLDSGRVVSGFIRDSSNIPIFEVDFDAFITSSGNELYTPSDNTDSTGYYEVVVPPGTLDLAYTPPLASRFAGASFAGASIVNDTAINLTLRHGVELSGTVRDSSANPISGVRVRAFGSPEVPLTKGTTDAVGSFAGILVPGTYTLHFVPPPASLFDSLVVSGVQVRVDSTIFTTLPRKPFSGIKGDLSNDGQLSPSDVVLMLNCVFAGTGTCPLSVADLNCSSNLTPADVVLELNLVFSGTTLPC